MSNDTTLTPGNYWARGQRVILTKGQNGVPYYDASIEVFENPDQPPLAILPWFGTTNTEFVSDTFAFLRAAGCDFRSRLAEDTSGFGSSVFRVYAGWYQPKKDGVPHGEKVLRVRGLSFEKEELSNAEKRQLSIALKDLLIASETPSKREFRPRKPIDSFNPPQTQHEDEIPF